MDTAKFDCRQDYDQALSGLVERPDSLELKHQAVLALARAGSLRFAQDEYQRYGLDDVQDDEDAIGLGARLLKDAFLKSEAPARRHLALRSAARYQFAFEKTGGYYSGINAATMTLLADGDPEDVRRRSNNILETLPDTINLSNEELYYVEATRAEAFLLLSETERSKVALQAAWQHDPLNYITHASTLRQLRLICENQSMDTGWLQKFAPPKATHYAGHTFSVQPSRQSKTVLSAQEQTLVRTNVSHAIQENDIGFGYGALSAGSDILIAETLLEEGADVHIVLPVGIEAFRGASVEPFGEEWSARYDDCLQAARSVTIINSDAVWPDRKLNRYAGKVAMGNALMQANFLSTGKLQLLILNQESESSYTQDHKLDWASAGYETVRLTLPQHHQSRADTVTAAPSAAPHIAMHASDHGDPASYETARRAALAALEYRDSSQGAVEIGIHAGFGGSFDDVASIAALLSSDSVPGGVVVTGEFAALLTAEAEQEFSVNYVGQFTAPNGSKQDLYSLIRRQPGHQLI